MILHTGGDHVIRAEDVGLDRLHGIKLAGGYLFQRRRVENIVHPAKGVNDGAVIPHIADIEFDLLRALGIAHLVFMAHVVLLLLVTGKDTDLADIRRQKAVQHRVSEGARPSGDQEGLLQKLGHFDLLYLLFQE